MKTNILKQLLFFLFICLIWSCSKKDSNEPTSNNPSVNGKLHYMILRNSNSTDTMEYLYDYSGRLITLYWKYLPNTKAVYSFMRSSTGQITRYSYQEPSYDFKETYDYSINNEGKYITANITKVELGNTSNSSEAYTYTGNQLTKINQSQSGHLVLTTEFTYDSRGNVSKRERHYEFGSLEITESTYDNNANPAGSLGAPTPISDGFIFGTNNFLSIKTTDQSSIETLTASYSYDNSGKPISAIYTGAVEGGTTFIQYKYY